VAEDRHASYEILAWRIALTTRYLVMGQGGATMIPSLETESMWARPMRLEDAEQVQKIFPQWEIVKHLGAVVPWPYRASASGLVGKEKRRKANEKASPTASASQGRGTAADQTLNRFYGRSNVSAT
jgi:hypothetical protein